MSKSDWIGAAITLIAAGLALLVGGPVVAVGAVAIGAVILVVAHLQGGKRPPELILEQTTPKESHEVRESGPSFPFIFGCPLGDNDSSEWIMMIKHYGPDTAFKCDIEFFDDDRKNIERLWRSDHPDYSFNPLGGIAGQSQRRFQIDEVSPQGPSENFRWTPVDCSSQHYSVSISCRDGYFVEKWEVTRVDGALRTKITLEHGPQWVEKHPMENPVIFTCTEPGFLGKPLASALPAKKPRPADPNWKADHHFSFPVAIIDPNGHVQVMKGIKLPDGSHKTDFGCWNMLTRHFGD
jgi:hypothetical protein